MPRLRFSKTGNAVWISHLDLMRALQRAFSRAGLLLKHSQGYTPHPELSIALPLSVGVASECELADFMLDEAAELSSLPERLNEKLPQGIRVLDCYEEGQKLKYLHFLKAELTLYYDAGVPDGAVDAILVLFSRPSLVVEKHGKNGPVPVDLIPMLRSLRVCAQTADRLTLIAVVSAQNPTLNPLLLPTAIAAHLPALAPDFSKCRRLELYDEQLQPFT